MIIIYVPRRLADWMTIHAGATEEWALRANVLTGLVNILATIPAITLINRIGQKPLLLVGSVGMTLTLGAMAAVFATAKSLL